MNLTPEQQAVDPNTPPEQLEKLCQLNNIELTRIVASHPNVTFQLLHRLANTKDIITLQNIAANFSTPSEILHLLAYTPLNNLIEDLEKIWERLTKTFRLPADDFYSFNLIIHNQFNFWALIEKEMRMKESIISTLREAYTIYRLVVRNPNTPPADLIRLGRTFTEDFLINPVLPLLILEDPYFMSKEELFFLTQVAIARHAKTPVNILKYLMVYGSTSVRTDIAANPNTPVEFLEKMTEDAIASPHYNLDLHITIAKNSKTPAYVLEQLVIYMDNLSDIEVGELRVSKGIIGGSMEYQKTNLAMALAGNINTPTKVLKHLAASKNVNKHLILKAIGGNPNTPAYIREQITS
jgi:hypothetical protein